MAPDLRLVARSVSACRYSTLNCLMNDDVLTARPYTALRPQSTVRSYVVSALRVPARSCSCTCRGPDRTGRTVKSVCRFSARRVLCLACGLPPGGRQTYLLLLTSARAVMPKSRFARDSVLVSCAPAPPCLTKSWPLAPTLAPPWHRLRRWHRRLRRWRCRYRLCHRRWCCRWAEAAAARTRQDSAGWPARCARWRTAGRTLRRWRRG